MAKLPDYVASAKPIPFSNRLGWLTTTAMTYAGIMLWFVFWQDVPLGKTLGKGALQNYSFFQGGTLAQGLGVAFLGLILAALICHFLFYLVPGLLGMKTGLPLYIVGTSVYGVQGGFFMPGFLMGVLQFGWLAVNSYFSAMLIVGTFGVKADTPPHFAVGAIWAIVAAFVGLKGIQYVGKVATFLPLIPLVILLILIGNTIGGVADFEPANMAAADPVAIKAANPEAFEGSAEEIQVQDPLSIFGVIALMCTYIVGFFATAGAAGTDFGMNNKDSGAIQKAGLIGVALVTIFTGGAALLIVAGAIGAEMADPALLRVTAFLPAILGNETAGICMLLLAVAAFPPACFASFIAANSFKTTLPKVNPFITCGLGTLAAIALVVSKQAGDAIAVFTVIGASFGPVCGAMAADYLLAGRKWSGPRAGFNPAGWISWIVGFIVGGIGLIIPTFDFVPAPPVSAFIVGFVLYYALSMMGLQSKTLEMPTEAPQEDTGQSAGDMAEEGGQS